MGAVISTYIVCGLLSTIILRYGTIWGRWFSSIWEFLFFLVVWWPCMLYILLRQARLALRQRIITIFSNDNGIMAEIARRIDFAVWWLGKRLLERTDKGELWRGPGPLGVGVLRLRVTDGTGIHWIRVPPQMERVQQALAWTFNVDEEDYKPDEEA